MAKSPTESNRKQHSNPEPANLANIWMMKTSDETKNCKLILIVEDDDDIRQVVADLLESEGYDTLTASNGKEALDILQGIEKPCLVLLDMMMPIMNGRQFLDTVMKDAVLAPIPVLIVSAIADRTNVEGSVGFLKKPIDIDVILEVVAQYCKNQK